MNGLFSLKNNSKLAAIYAPVNGEVIHESNIPDVAFASGMLGEGLGIIPKDGHFVSPVNGTVVDVTATKHAFSFTTDDGAEILLHIGIDTVTLKGEGFNVFVKNGDKVRVGDRIAEVDLELIKSKGLSEISALIIINPDEFSQITVFEGECRAASSSILNFVTNQNNK